MIQVGYILSVVHTTCWTMTQEMRIWMGHLKTWKLKIPSKAAFFAWRLIRDRLPTKSNLCRRDIDINDKMCPFCRDKEE